MATRTLITPTRGNGSNRPGAGLATPKDTNPHLGAESILTAPAAATRSHQAAVAAAAPADDAIAPTLMVRLNRAVRESNTLTRRIEELEGELEQRTRRLQQLIGERDELRSLLVGRDGELQRLNREFGALAARAAPAQGGSPAPFAAARTLLHKLLRTRTASRAAKPAKHSPHRADVGTNEPRLVPWLKDRPPKEVLAVVVFGLSAAEIERVLEAVEGYCTEHEAAPLLLTDNDAFQLFRSRRVLFEFLPARAEQRRLAPDLDWQLFTLRRLALIRRKWRPTQVVAFGRTAAEVVQRWLESPFEQTPVPAPLKGRAQGAELGLRAARVAEVM
jgi:hypothetical protein